MGLFCEMQEGTILGALKFNGLLPWELDADLTLHAKNYTAFGEKVIPYFAENGYTWVRSDQKVKAVVIAMFSWLASAVGTGHTDFMRLARSKTQKYQYPFNR